MNRRLWRWLRVFWNNHEYLPKGFRHHEISMRRLDADFIDKLTVFRPCWRHGSRIKANGGYIQHVLPVSPIFIDTCYWCSEEPGTTLFEGLKYCRECYLDALERQARAQIRKEENLRLKVVLMTGIFFQ